jgi:mannose-6-phosphate isomerase-like protein (cupin superfamily)
VSTNGGGEVDPVRRVDFAAFEATAERVTQKLLDRTNGGTSCTVSAIKTPPGAGSPEGMHTHVVDQIFYILRGTMGIEIAGRREDVGPGSLVVFPAGVPHRNWNAGTEPTVHLNIAAPSPDPALPFARRVGA